MAIFSTNTETEMEQIPLRQHQLRESGNLIKTLIVNGNSEPELGCCCFKTSYKPTKLLRIPHYKSRKLQYITHFLMKCCSCFEEIRWRINLFGLYNPFNKIYCNCKYGYYIARITISDIIIFITFFIIEFFPLYNAMITNNKNEAHFNQKLKNISLAFGHESVKNYALTLLFSQRNTLMNILFGLPLDRAIIYHKFMGVLSLLFSYIHFILMLFYWNNNNLNIWNQIIESDNNSGTNLSGFIAFIFINIAAIIALKYIRTHCFEMFLKTHWICVIGFIIFIWKHNDKFGENVLIIIAIILWIIDLFWRFWIIFGRKKTAQIVNIQFIAGDIIKMEWMKQKFAFNGGQYVFVCLPNISVTEWHPLSMTSGPKDDCLLFHIKCAGDWCEKLKYLITKGKIYDWNKLFLLIEGPYGRPSIPFHKYSSIILMCGGIGITTHCSIFSDLMEIVRSNKNNQIKRIHFVWCCKYGEIIKEFDTIHYNVIKKYTEYDNEQNVKFAEEIILNNVIIKTSYYITRVKNREEQNKWNDMYTNLHFERANVNDIIKEALRSDGHECVGIMGCGPMGMLYDIRNQSAIHNIHCHTEYYHF